MRNAQHAEQAESDEGTLGQLAPDDLADFVFFVLRETHFRHGLQELSFDLVARIDGAADR